MMLHKYEEIAFAIFIVYCMIRTGLLMAASKMPMFASLHPVEEIIMFIVMGYAVLRIIMMSFTKD